MSTVLGEVEGVSVGPWARKNQLTHRKQACRTTDKGLTEQGWPPPNKNHFMPLPLGLSPHATQRDTGR